MKTKQNAQHTAQTQHSNDHEAVKSLLLSQIDSMDSLNRKMDSGSKMNEDAKTSPDKVATAVIKTNTSDRNDCNVKRHQAKRRENKRKNSKNRYANQSDEQKKEKAKKRKQKREDEWKNKYYNRHNKMTTEEINHHTKSPDKEYKTIQTNNDECVSIPTRHHRSKHVIVPIGVKKLYYKLQQCKQKII